MVVEMIASRLPSVITRQLDWWYYWGKTAKIMTRNFKRWSLVVIMGSRNWSTIRVFQQYRPLALRGHVTNASSKQWVGVLLMPKIDRAHKNYLTPEIWEEMHLREIFYGTLILQQRVYALKHGGQNKSYYFVEKSKCHKIFPINAVPLKFRV